MKRILLSLVGMLAVISMASARRMFITLYPCPGGGSDAYSAGYVDDRTGISYLVTSDCSGAICVYPLYGPFQPRVSSQSEWRLPDDYHELVQDASARKEPGAYVGIWVTDKLSGDSLKFRNPVDETERQHYLQLWMENENAGSSTISLHGESAIDEILQRNLANRSTEERLNGELIDRYWRNRFGENGWPAADQLQSLTNASALIVQNGSSIVIKQFPLPSNGEMLIIEPLLPELSGPASIHDATGRVVWSEELTATATIPLHQLPSGLYIVRGLGKDIPISLVR